MFFKKINKRFLRIQTDLSTFCNLKCRMCYFHVKKGTNNARVTYEQFKQLFGSFADRISLLGLSCGTEPLLAREDDLIKILIFIRKMKIPMSEIVTNGTLMSKPIAQAFVKYGLSMVYVSIDSHIKEKYENIRVGAKFEKVVNNVKYLIDYRNSKGAKKPLVCINCVLGKYNIEDVPAYLDSLYQLGVDAVDFRHLVLHEGCELHDQSLNKYKALTNLYFNFIRQRCQKLGILLQYLPPNFDESSIGIEEKNQVKEIVLPSVTAKRPKRFPQWQLIKCESVEQNRNANSSHTEDMPIAPAIVSATVEEAAPQSPAEDAESLRSEGAQRKCLIPMSFMQVRPNGDVLPCCYWYAEPPIGNLFATDFYELWNEKEYEKFRWEVAHGVFKRQCCINCPAMGSGDVNEDGGFDVKQTLLK